MADFRKWFYALAVVALIAGFTVPMCAQSPPFQSVANAGVPAIINGTTTEGYTKLASITLNETAAVPTACGGFQIARLGIEGRPPTTPTPMLLASTLPIHLVLPGNGRLDTFIAHALLFADTPAAEVLDTSFTVNLATNQTEPIPMISYLAQIQAPPAYFLTTARTNTPLLEGLYVTPVAWSLDNRQADTITQAQFQYCHANDVADNFTAQTPSAGYRIATASWASAKRLENRVH